MRRRVVCGWSLMMLTLLPTSRLTSVDLPTFGRPSRATKPLCRPPSGRRRLRRPLHRALTGERRREQLAQRQRAYRRRSCAATMTGSPNSASACRQTPQGSASRPSAVATATAVRRRSPAVTAAPSATRSAHTPAGDDGALDVDAEMHARPTRPAHGGADPEAPSTARSALPADLGGRRHSSRSAASAALPASAVTARPASQREPEP